ncbi:MAG: KilA-N domain-containing protein [Lachnospiraceae bacterium]|nr:KilA-N domain-containing protein [bacterium]MDY5516594.1 KilA-N domain-containing protein [Lachnospiraceae bacterium]
MAKPMKKETIHANGIDIGIYTTDFENEYISLTDIAKYRSIQPSITIHNWLRGRDVIDFLGLWESLHNPDFKLIEFDKFKENAGSNAYVFSIKDWTEKLGAVGLKTKSGRYGGGIYAHIDIAFESILIEQGMHQEERMPLLRKLVVQQLKTLEALDMNSLPGIEQK